MKSIFHVIFVSTTILFFTFGMPFFDPEPTGKVLLDPNTQQIRAQHKCIGGIYDNETGDYIDSLWPPDEEETVLATFSAQASLRGG